MSGRPYTFMQLARRYLHYYFNALNSRGHGIHSPFVYGVVRDLLNDRRDMADFGAIESLRSKLQEDKRLVTLTDYGAGSGQGDRPEKTVGQITRTAAKQPRLAQLLFRTVQYFKAVTIVELGTSVGLTTAYLAAANKQGSVFSLEGDPTLAEIATENLHTLALTNFEVITGDFDNTLGPLLERIGSADLVYIDGNHRYEPTLRYFKQALTVAHRDTVIILDDIHWSQEMESAWKSIQSMDSVTATIDIFFLGFVFIRPEFKEVSHFSVRYR